MNVTDHKDYHLNLIYKESKPKSDSELILKKINSQNSPGSLYMNFKPLEY
jgi:hypothetical protein